MKVIAVGHGVVGLRFVGALRARDTGDRWQVTVLAEETRPANNRVRLSGFFEETTDPTYDLETFRAHATGRAVGAVIGGGRLGPEAAISFVSERGQPVPVVLGARP